MKVTVDNLSYITFLLKRVIKYNFLIQWFYNSSIKHNNVLNYFNIPNDKLKFDSLYKVESSMEFEFSKIDIYYEKDRIIIESEEYMHVIEINDDIKFNKNLIIHRTTHPTEYSKCICKITNFE